MAEDIAEFDYQPDEKVGSSKAGSSKSVKWTASEYIDHQRGASWYLGLVVLTAVLTAAIYLFTKDYFATGTTVVLGIIVGSVAHWKPRQVDYELSASGLQAGEKFYAFSQFKTFSIVREGDLSSLVLNPLKRFMPPLSAFIDEDDEQKITEIIGEHLPMQEGSADRIDRLSRRLRF